MFEVAMLVFQVCGFLSGGLVAGWRARKQGDLQALAGFAIFHDGHLVFWSFVQCCFSRYEENWRIYIILDETAHADVFPAILPFVFVNSGAGERGYLDRLLQAISVVLRRQCCRWYLQAGGLGAGDAIGTLDTRSFFIFPDAGRWKSGVYRLNRHLGCTVFCCSVGYRHSGNKKTFRSRHVWCGLLGGVVSNQLCVSSWYQLVSRIPCCVAGLICWHLGVTPWVRIKFFRQFAFCQRALLLGLAMMLVILLFDPVISGVWRVGFAGAGGWFPKLAIVLYSLVDVSYVALIYQATNRLILTCYLPRCGY